MDTFIKVVNKVDSKFNFMLLVIGEGNEREKLEELILDKDKVKIVGFQNEENVPYLYNMADIFVFCTRYDGWELHFK